MVDAPFFISVEEALAISCKTPPKVGVEHVPIWESTGRILGEDLASKVDDPPFDNSSMDGFAARFNPDATYPRALDIVGTQAATGANETLTVDVGQAARIMTGAPMPPGADAILPIERCEVNGDTVTLLEAPKPHFVRRQGENLQL